VASNLECVGLPVADRGQFGKFVESALAGSELVGTVGRVSVYGWQDLSGARLVIATRGREVVDLLPSSAGAPGARLADVRAVNDDVAVASVVDESGEVTTMLAVELEQRRLLGATSNPSGVRRASWRWVSMSACMPMRRRSPPRMPAC
jgi:hypothetical protein